MRKVIVFAHTFVEPAGARLTQVASPEWHNGHEVHPIGQAQMASDGTITEDLLIRDEKSGATGMIRNIIKPGDKRYRRYIGHIGGLKPGETKLVKNDWD